ncbi:MAG: OmpA family protein [Gemmatimonadetes bacterium]|nr:OmpA family protein [Gemmatimonadota bacterium]
MLDSRPVRTLLALLLLPALSGCVKKGTHQRALDEIAQARIDQQALQVEMRERLAEADADRRAAAEERRVAEERLRADLAAVRDSLETMTERRAEAEARFEEARTEVYRLEVLQRDRGAEFQRLQQRLQSLAAIEREVRQRNAIYEEVIGRFQSLIDAGRLSVAIDRGRMVIQLPQDILFESGSATLGSDGRSTLAEVAEVLADIDDRSFQVEGHTDDVPIATARFPSNWELSTARALSVVRLLVDRGVNPMTLSGAGYGEFRPVADNGDAQGRRQNRRIEIVMLPNLDVIAAAQLPAGG